jgi:hypothetical protein
MDEPCRRNSVSRKERIEKELQRAADARYCEDVEDEATLNKGMAAELTEKTEARGCRRIEGRKSGHWAGGA